MKNILFITSLFLATICQATANFEDQKIIQQSFATSADFELDITNKHGNIDFISWDKDSISLKAVIKVGSNRLKTVHDVINNIDIEFIERTNYLSIRTTWGVTGSNFRADFLKLMNNQSVIVNYEIHVPIGIQIAVKNKFGNISFEDHQGELKIALAHGKLYAGKLAKVDLLQLQYADLLAKSVEEGDIVGRFSDINIKKANEIKLDALSCDVEIDEITSLNAKLISSALEVEQMNTCEFEANLSSIEIEVLEQSIEGSLRFGDLEVEEVRPQFNHIELEGTNTDIQLDFNPEIAYRYFVSLEKGKSFRVPTLGNSLDKEDDLGEIKEYTGVFATIPVGGLPPEVSISGKNTYVTFGLK